MDNIYINGKMKDSKVKYILQKVKTSGLIAVAGFTTVIGLLIAINSFKGDDFEYQPDKNFGNEFTTQYLGWLSEEKGEEVEISNEISNILNEVVPSYYMSKDNYEDVSSIDGVNENDLKNSSMSVVSATEELKRSSMQIVEIKLREKFGLSDNASIKIEKHENSADGLSYSISIQDNNQKYYMLSNAVLGESKIPDEYQGVINTYYNLEKYNGDGSNIEAWNKKTMKKYIDTADSLLYDILSLSTKTYQENKAKNL